MLTRQLARHRRRRPALRRGFTLVELMVAVVIMTVGVLALAGTSAIVSRLIGGAGQRTVAANTAASRFEKIVGRRCTTIASGTATANGMREHWGVDSTLDAVTFRVVDTVWFTNTRGLTSQQVFRTNIRRLAC